MNTPRAITIALIMTVTVSVSAQQFLPVKGINNARHLGGITVQDGRVVRDNMLIRSAHLADASDADIDYLNSISLAKIIDFRKNGELAGNIDRPVSGAEYFPLPIDASGKAAEEATDEEKKKLSGRKKFDIRKIIVLLAFNKKAQAVAKEMYRTLLFDPECQAQYAEFFREVIATGEGAILYHCSQGKDRTGIASALLLSALGADRETVIADFDATNIVYETDVRKYCRRVRFLGGKEDEIDVVKSFLGANTANFAKALDEIDARFGSMDAYLRGPIGLSTSEIQTLRERYLR